jgi:hypothetical protein
MMWITSAAPGPACDDRRAMPLLGAGCLAVVGALLLLAAVAALQLFDHVPGWAVPPLFAGLLLGLAALAQWLFGGRWADAFGALAPEERARRLEEQGRLESTTFHVTRAFGVVEGGDEDVHYFLEIDDGRVLFLDGPSVADYEPFDDGAALPRPRRFPCTEVTLCRHKDGGALVHVRCAGSVVEPEMLPPFAPAGGAALRLPANGAVFDDRSYDELRREKRAASAGPA